MPTEATQISPKRDLPKAGLGFWMERVIEECDHASVNFAADPVHDLRVALRRCRSMADGLMAMDPDPGWKQMKKAGKRLFGRLGELRDVQVMDEWVRRLGSPDDPVTSSLLQSLSGREAMLKQEAAQALQEFDRKQWKRWSTLLPRRAARIPTGGLVFKHLALERWTQAYALHRRALQNRSQTAFHSLRIGLKRFRYIAENFLPEQHAAWGRDLKELQDLLGEVHDLDVLWATALRAQVFADHDSHARWRQRIRMEHDQRTTAYRTRMTGRHSLWNVWREQLPQDRQIEAGALGRFRLWAANLDPEFRHSVHVARLALQLYDGLPRVGGVDTELRDPRDLLHVSALLHDVGRSGKDKAYHKTSYRLIRKITPPLGWTAHDLALLAIIARYHRGALPRTGQKALRSLALGQRRVAVRLAAILRLASALDADRSGRIQHLEVGERNGFLVVSARGYSALDGMAETIASARHLLEIVYRRPVMVKELKSRTAKVLSMPVRKRGLSAR